MSGAYDFPHLTVSNVFVMNLFEDWGDLKTSTIFFLFNFFFFFFFSPNFWACLTPGQTTGTDHWDRPREELLSPRGRVSNDSAGNTLSVLVKDYLYSVYSVSFSSSKKSNHLHF